MAGYYLRLALRSLRQVVRFISYLLPPRYYGTLSQTIFLAGDVWAVIVPNAAVLAGMGAVLLARTAGTSRKKLA